MPQNSSGIKPYDWVIKNVKTKDWVEWIASHELKIDYSDIETWKPENWGHWGKDGPPVHLKSGQKFWYVDRKRVAEKMLLLCPKQATLKHQGGRHYLMVGSEKLWSSKHKEVAECALEAFNAGDIPRLLALEPAYVATSSPPTSLAQTKPIWTAKPRKLSDADFKSLQDAKATIGRAGELIAFEDEKQRLLAEVGCTDPAQYVTLLAIEDVGAGYDIKSSYPGHERYIEVKSSTQHTNEFYITKNERDTLTAKGERAWIYIVKVDQDMQGGELVSMLSNPFAEPIKVELTETAWKATIKT